MVHRDSANVPVPLFYARFHSVRQPRKAVGQHIPEVWPLRKQGIRLTRWEGEVEEHGPLAWGLSVIVGGEYKVVEIF
jgi:hypothetical protein